MKNTEKHFAQFINLILLLLASFSSQAQTCPTGLGTVVNIASLPYNATGLTTCGNGNKVGHLTATICAEAFWNYGEDRTFIFTPTVTDTFAIVLKTDRTTATMNLYNACPLNGQGGSCVAQVQTTSNPPFKALVIQLTAGTTYYLVIDDSASPGGQCIPSFDLSILKQPTNDDCGGAVTLTPGSASVCTAISGNTFAASRTLPAANVCGGSVDDDVWYKFVATSSYHTITATPLAPTLNIDLYIDVRAGSCTGTNVACSWQGDGVGVTEVVAMSGLTIGTTYFVRIYTGTSQNAEFRGYFTVCLTTPAPPLPVELVAFKAKAEKDAIQLTWQTASERNNTGFQVERSENGRDFKQIAFILGAGTSAEKHTYQLEDKNVRAGQPYFYRLKQMDNDGSFQYSDIVQAVLSGGTLTFIVFPNPAPADGVVQIQLQSPEASEVGLTIINAQGVVFRTERYDTDPEVQTLQMPINDLPANTYILQATANGVSKYQKLIITN